MIFLLFVHSLWFKNERTSFDTSGSMKRCARLSVVGLLDDIVDFDMRIAMMTTNAPEDLSSQDPQPVSARPVFNNDTT